MNDQPAPFDICGPLPSGTTVLEASAGTGKTHAIAALAARYLAEGQVELDQLMLVTFGRMATNELRLRVRDRLVSLAAALAQAAESRATDPQDSLAALLTDVPPAELAERQRRIARALADFDAATIATTHEFCLQMLDGLGVLGDREPQATFVEHLSDLTREVATDLYLSRYATSGQSRRSTTRRRSASPTTPSRRCTPGWCRTESIRTRSPTRPSGWLSRSPSAPRSTGASGPAGCSPTTTC